MQLRAVVMARPGVPVLGPIVHEEEQARPRQALDQHVEERPRLGVDPVQVFEDQH